MVDRRFFVPPKPHSVSQIAALIGGAVGNPALADRLISDVAPLDSAGGDCLSFLDNRRYRAAARTTGAAACIVRESDASLLPDSCAAIICEQPYQGYALAARALYPPRRPDAVIHASAVIDETARIGNGCAIGPGCVIGADVEIGEGTVLAAQVHVADGVVIGAGCRIDSQVSISHAILGDGVRLYPGVRIGQDGFGFAMSAKGHLPIPQLGRVLIGKDVHIGANSTIDRGAGPDTVIEDGVMIDNLVQIGHNVRIGKGCVIVAQAGVSGSTVLENHVVLAAQGGIAGHLTIGAGARIAAKSGIMRDVAPGSDMMGYPAVPKTQFFRQIARLAQLVKGKD